jgi:tRNA (guanine-N7-)-methyltransferase
LPQNFTLGRPKLEKFAELALIPSVYQRDSCMKGKWGSEHFNNDHPIVLELACGKGDYTRGMATLFPEKNFIGVDIKGNRLWTAARLAEEGDLNNVAFIREQIDHLADYFEPGEVSEIWITFPDPFPRKREIKKRLTSPKFLDVYRKIVLPGTKINLKTDSDGLYEYTLEVITEQNLEVVKNYPDIYAAGVTHEVHGIQTYYEKMHLKEGRTIKYLCFLL